MAPKSLFNRDDDDDGSERTGARPEGEASEGVRLIDPDEAAQAVERGEAVRRRGGDTPRYGDRPSSPPPGPRPALRFPLADSADPGDIERPRAAPVEPDAPPPPEPPAQEAPPIISLDPPSGEVELPHWTEPATGEVPRVIVGEEDEAEATARWEAFAAGPRWRDEHEDWSGEGDLGDLAHDEGSRVGALDTERPTTEQIVTFEDLEVPIEPVTSTPSPTPPASRPRPVRPGAEPEVPERRRGGAPGDRGGSGGGPPIEPPGPETAGVGGRNMGQAVAVGLGLGFGALLLAWLGAGWLMVLAEVIIVLAAVEYFGAVRRAGYNPPTLLGLVAVAALPWAAFARGDAAIPLVLFLLVAFGMVWYLAGVGSSQPVRNLGITGLVVLHVGVLGAFSALILRIGPVTGSGVDQGVSILLLAVIAAVFYDVGGLFVGSRFGQTPFSPISPNKTLEGLLGGMGAAVVAVLVAWGFPLFGLTEFSFGQALVFGLLCAVAAPIGDLSESLIKRDLGIKDMGALLPGHGGVFDRFDALLFVLPTAYYVVRVFYGG